MKLILVKTSKLPPGYTGPILLPMDELPDVEDGQEVACTLSTNKKTVRTIQQNKAIRVYGNKVSEKLNDGGITKQIYFEKKSVDCEWTPESFIEDVWREVQEAMYGHRSTSKLTPAQVSKVYNQVARILAENFTIDQDFPSLDSLMNERLGRR